MNLDEAISEITRRIAAASPSAIIRVSRVSDEEAGIRAYAPLADEAAIKEATQDFTIQLLTNEGFDVQVLVYDVTTSLPPDE